MMTVTEPERVPILLDPNDTRATAPVPPNRIWDGMFVSNETWAGLKRILALAEAVKSNKLKSIGGLEVHISKYTLFGTAAIFQWSNRAGIDYADPAKTFLMSQQPHVVALLDFTKELEDDDSN